MRVAYRCKEYNDALAAAYMEALIKKHRDDIEYLHLIQSDGCLEIAREGYIGLVESPFIRKTGIVVFRGGPLLIRSHYVGLRCVGTVIECASLFSSIITDVMKGNWTRSEPAATQWEDSLLLFGVPVPNIERKMFTHGLLSDGSN